MILLIYVRSETYRCSTPVDTVYDNPPPPDESSFIGHRHSEIIPNFASNRVDRATFTAEIVPRQWMFPTTLDSRKTIASIGIDGGNFTLLDSFADGWSQSSRSPVVGCIHVSNYALSKANISLYKPTKYQIILKLISNTLVVKHKMYYCYL